MPNDLTMLETVGHPYIVSGAHPVLRDRGFAIIGTTTSRRWDGKYGLYWVESRVNPRPGPIRLV